MAKDLNNVAKPGDLIDLDGCRYVIVEAWYLLGVLAFRLDGDRVVGHRTIDYEAFRDGAAKVAGRLDGPLVEALAAVATRRGRLDDAFDALMNHVGVTHGEQALEEALKATRPALES